MEVISIEIIWEVPVSHRNYNRHVCLNLRHVESNSQILCIPFICVVVIGL